MSMHNVGDAPLVTYRLVDPSTVPPTPIDGTITAALTSPNGTVSTLPVTRTAQGVYTATPSLAVAGDWQVTFTTTAPVQDVETVTLVAVDTTITTPGWAPTLGDVAAHIPTRTRAVGTDDTFLMTFTTDTTPTAEAAAVLIAHACTRVTAAVGSPVAAPAQALAGVAAALLAAYYVEIAYPERNADVAVYDRLLVEAKAAMASAAEVNSAAGGATTTDPTEDAAPGGIGFAFPDPPTFADAVFSW